MELPLQSPAMTLFFFQILVFCSEVVQTLVPDADQVAKNLKVSHFDCGEMTENTLYALNQVRQIHITPEEFEISQTKVIIYTKHFQKELNATKCRIQHQRAKWHCGHNDHSSIDHTTAGITSDLIISPEQCRSLAKGKSIYLADQFLAVEYDTKNPIVKTDGFTTDSNRNHCNVRGRITRDTILPHMQRTTLKVEMLTEKVLSDSAQVLPCALEELGCETNSLDPYAYCWDYPDNCVLSVLRTEDVNMVKQGTKYYTISGPNSTTKFVFEVKKNPQKHCGKPTDIYPTNYDSLYVAIISWGFDLRSGRNLGKERNGATQLLQYIPPTENNGFAQLREYDPKHTSHKTSDEDMYLKMDYEVHMGTELDYLFFQSYRLLQISEIQLLKNQCEQERTQILTILMLSLGNPRLAGYMFIANRSRFLETDGSLAWFYNCPVFHLLLHTMNQCYNRIPILYERQTQFVDPITEQTHPASNKQICTDRIKTYFNSTWIKKTHGTH